MSVLVFFAIAFISFFLIVAIVAFFGTLLLGKPNEDLSNYTSRDSDATRIVKGLIETVDKNGTSSSAFSKGDAVTAFGNKGIVKNITANGMFVEVQFEGAPCTTLFELDGKCMKWNKCPSLEKL